MFKWGLFPYIHDIITMESTKKLQAMISVVSTMLLKGLHGATSMANYREQDMVTVNVSMQQIQQYILFIKRNTVPLSCTLNSVFCIITWNPVV